ncbi:MAG: hypothetical protein IJB02_02100, partial [Oscillospiraceae bacterium]|nr:hypothetical protein [Oscillospiraceae bacterium]
CNRAAGVLSCWGPRRMSSARTPSSIADPGHSLKSLDLPQAALLSLPPPYGVVCKLVDKLEFEEVK